MITQDELLDILSTSPRYFCTKWIGQQMRIQMLILRFQARNQDFMWGGANEAKVDPTTEMYFLFSDPFI